MSRGDKGGSHKHWTKADINELWDMYYKQRLNVKTIAQHFGVSTQSVYCVIERRKRAVK